MDRVPTDSKSALIDSSSVLDDAFRNAAIRNDISVCTNHCHPGPWHVEGSVGAAVAATTLSGELRSHSGKFQGQGRIPGLGPELGRACDVRAWSLGQEWWILVGKVAF